MTKDKNTDQELEAIFAAARDANPEPNDALYARVLEDAEALQPNQSSLVSDRPTGSRQMRNRLRFFGALGGWPVAAGLVSAGIAGIWIGVSPPTFLVQSSLALFPDVTSGLVWGLTTEARVFEIAGGV